ncbi:hypothetical protein [Nocardia sp. NPDC020380]|uniref:hypothetical protein n=1 Tax=Nocardia sp. NPDC020380 TaxID=3364309 RepID=UPI00379152E8
MPWPARCARPNNDLTGLRTLHLQAHSQIAVLAPEHPLAVRDGGELTHLVTTHRAVALLPDSAVGQFPRSLPCIPVADAEPIVSVLAWLPDTESPALSAFLRHSRALAERLETIAVTSPVQ